MSQGISGNLFFEISNYCFNPHFQKVQARITQIGIPATRPLVHLIAT